MIERGSTKHTILEACDRLFYTLGLRAVSIDDIAAAAGVTKRTVYYHFASKDLMIERWLEARAERARAETNSYGGDPCERLMQSYRVLEMQVAHPLFRGCPFVNAVAELADPTHPAVAVARTYKNDRFDWFRKIASDAGKPDDVAELLLILWEGAIQRAVVDRNVAAVGRAATMAVAAIR